MAEIYKPEQTTYWIAYSNDNQIVHWGETNPESVTTSGMDNFEYNIDKVTLIRRLEELGYETKMYDDNQEEILPVKETIQVAEMVEQQVMIKGQLTTEQVEVLKPVEVTKYYDSQAQEIDIFSMKQRTVLTVK